MKLTQEYKHMAQHNLKVFEITFTEEEKEETKILYDKHQQKLLDKMDPLIGEQFEVQKYSIRIFDPVHKKIVVDVIDITEAVAEEKKNGKEDQD